MSMSRPGEALRLYVLWRKGCVVLTASLDDKKATSAALDRFVSFLAFGPKFLKEVWPEDLSDAPRAKRSTKRKHTNQHKRSQTAHALPMYQLAHLLLKTPDGDGSGEQRGGRDKYSQKKYCRGNMTFIAEGTFVEAVPLAPVCPISVGGRERRREFGES